MQIKRQTLKMEWVREAHGWAVACETVFSVSLWEEGYSRRSHLSASLDIPLCWRGRQFTGGKGQEPRFVCEAMKDIYPTLTVNPWCANLDVAPLWILPLLLPPGRPCFPLYTFIWGPVKIVLMKMHVHLHFGNGYCLFQFHSLVPNTGLDKGLLGWHLSISHFDVCL